MTNISFSRWIALALTVAGGLTTTLAHAQEPANKNRGAFMAAGKVGGFVPFSKLSAHVSASLELGYAFGPGRSFVGYLDVSYAVPQANGKASDSA